MFCSACGAQIQPHYSICPNCQRPISAAMTPSLPGRFDRHVHILGILWIIAGALFLIPAFILVIVSNFVRFAIPAAETLGRFVAPLVLSVIGGSLFIVAACGILLGWGLLRLQPWARMAAIVVGIVALLHPPFGTALGIYTLWVLLTDQRGVEYDRLAHAA